jgi:hypothetical protein
MNNIWEATKKVTCFLYAIPVSYFWDQVDEQSEKRRGSHWCRHPKQHHADVQIDLKRSFKLNGRWTSPEGYTGFGKLADGKRHMSAQNFDI